MRRSIIIMYTVIFLAGCSATETATFSVPANYRTWQKATKRILDYEVPGHGATIRLIYGNDIAFSAAGNEYFRSQTAVSLEQEHRTPSGGSPQCGDNTGPSAANNHNVISLT